MLADIYTGTVGALSNYEGRRGMKVKLIVLLGVAIVLMLITASSAFAVQDQIEPIDYPEGYWDFLCPTGSKAVLDPDGLPLLDEDCLAEYLPQSAIGAADPDPDGELPELEKCVVCEQVTQMSEETPAVQQDAYTEAATTTRSTMPSTGAFLLPAAGLLAAGAGLLISRKRG